MNLRQIKYFIALYEEESITRAARRLHVVQPAVSMQLRKLEDDHGVMLFERTPQKLVPTVAARRLYPLCVKILADLRTAQELLDDSSGKVSGSLSVGVLPSVAQSLLGDVLVDFTGEFPEVTVRCYEGYSGNVSDWLAQGTLDLAIVTLVEGEGRLRLQPLVTEELMVVTAPGADLGRGDATTGQELMKLRLVLPSRRNTLRALIDGAFERAGLQIDAALEIDSLSTVFRLVEQPGWASVVPATALRGSHVRQRLSCLGLREPTISRTLAVAHHPAHEPSLAAQKFIEVLERQIAADAPRR